MILPFTYLFLTTRANLLGKIFVKNVCLVFTFLFQLEVKFFLNIFNAGKSPGKQFTTVITYLQLSQYVIMSG